MSLVSEQHSMRNPRAVLHWYDFLCPFCYIGQSRNALLVQHGFYLVELTFQRFTPKFHTAGFRKKLNVLFIPLRGCLRAFPGRSRYWVFIVRAVRRRRSGYIPTAWSPGVRQPRREALSFGLAFSGAGQF
jgi:hypothetical protein